VAFVTALRRSGLEVPVQGTVAYAEAVTALAPSTGRAHYWAGRATLVHRPEDIPTYDLVYAAFWGGRRREASPPPPPMSRLDAEDTDAGAPYSDHEVLSAKDFAAYTDTELHEARRLMADLRFVGPRRRSRRHVPTRRRRGRPDLRRTTRHAIRAGGEPVRPARRGPSTRRRRLVLLLDVSGSMSDYSRALLQFAHSARIARRRVEVFVLGTRLTRLTRELDSPDADAALDAAGAAVEDWSGGTRLGESLARFNDEWGVRGLARGATVIVVSDGWDRGDVDLLAEQMARLHRVAHRVVWVNPLKASPGYEPLAAGMAAALPHVDHFVEGHSLDALSALAAVVEEER
jgi:uncharacterized protein with von Willebrand factor type A (vWA) domain